MSAVRNWLNAVFIEESRGKPDLEAIIQTFCTAALFAADDLNSPSDRAEALAFMTHISLHIETSFQIDHEYLPYLYLAWRLDSENLSVAFEVLCNYGTEPDDHTDREFLDQALDCLARHWPSTSDSKKEMIRSWVDRLRDQGVCGFPEVILKGE